MDQSQRLPVTEVFADPDGNSGDRDKNVVGARGGEKKRESAASVHRGNFSPNRIQGSSTVFAHPAP